jgi:hypothetical protein
MGWNPARDMDVLIYYVFMLSCVGSGFATGWFPVQTVLPTVYKIKELTWNGVLRMPYAPEVTTVIKYENK